MLSRNLTTNPGVGTQAFDAENHLVSAGGQSYAYDGDGNRIWKAPVATPTSPTLIYWYGGSGNLLQESDGAGIGQYTHIYFNGRRIKRVEWTHGGWFDHYAYDHLGNARWVYGYNGTWDLSEYYPFGGERPISSGEGNKFKFTGKERDSESGLDNFAARFDSSTLGRFMSPDPLGSHQEDPQTMNRYPYVRNNPLNLTDPTGLDFYLQCTTDNHSGCVQVETVKGDKDSSRWVQAGSDGHATIITSESISSGENMAWVNEAGVVINATSQGIYFDNEASHTTIDGKDVNLNPIDLAGHGSLENFKFTINGNCGGSCLSSGSYKFQGTDDQARSLLGQRGSFTMIGDVFSGHEGTQHRFNDFNNPTGPSPHLSVPDNAHFFPDAGIILRFPKATVPSVGEFHVDAHGTTASHAACDLLKLC